MKIDELNDEALATAARELVAIYAGYKAECERLSAAVEAFKAWTEGKGRRPARKMWPDYVLSPKLNGVSERLDDEGGGAACGVRQGVPSAEDGGDGGRLSQFSCFVQVLPGARNGVLRGWSWGEGNFPLHFPGKYGIIHGNGKRESEER